MHGLEELGFWLFDARVRFVITMGGFHLCSMGGVATQPPLPSRTHEPCNPVHRTDHRGIKCPIHQ